MKIASVVERAFARGGIRIQVNYRAADGSPFITHNPHPACSARSDHLRQFRRRLRKTVAEQNFELSASPDQAGAEGEGAFCIIK